MNKASILKRSVTRRRFLQFSTMAMAGSSTLAWSHWTSQARLSEQIKQRQAVHLPSVSMQPPNVLIIVMDTVRYDRFGPTNPISLTPSLNQIAAKGIRYENAWANSSWSLPSQASILTGHYPHVHGADWPELQLNQSIPTLGEFFTKLGYVTGAFSGNSAWITPEYLGRGFLRFDVYTLEDHLRRTVHGRKVDRFSRFLGYHYAGRGKKAPTINAQFLQFLDDYPNYPFFAYLCYMDVNQGFHHRQLNYAFWEQPPTVPEVVEAYDQALTVLDMQIADLLTDLEQRGIMENSLLIITSDHGESFGALHTNDHDPEGHGTSLYPEQTRVPVFVIYPGHVPAGLTVMSSVGLEAIPATITHLLGIQNAPFSGTPLPVAEGTHEGRAVLTTLNYDERRLQAVVHDQWLYLRDLNNVQEQGELYDLAADPLAHRNLALADTEFSATLSEMQTFLANLLANSV